MKNHQNHYARNKSNRKGIGKVTIGKMTIGKVTIGKVTIVKETDFFYDFGRFSNNL